MNTLDDMRLYLLALEKQYEQRCNSTPNNANPSVVATIKLQLVQHLLSEIPDND